MRYIILPMMFFLLGLTLQFGVYTIRKDMKAYGLSLVGLTLIYYAPSTPWSFKCVCGAITDSFGFRGYHRLPYLVMSNFLSIICCVVLMLPALTLDSYIAVLFFLNFFAAWGSVVFKAMMAEDSARETKKTQGTMQFRCNSAYDLGSLLASTGPSAWEFLGSKFVYGIMAGFYFVLLVLGMFLPDYKVKNITPLQSETGVQTSELGPAGETLSTERIVSNKHSYSKQFCIQISLVKETFSNPILGKTLFFVLMTQVFPSPGMAMFFFMSDELGFTPTQMGIISAISTASGFFMNFVYFKWFTRIPLSHLLGALQLLRILFGGLPYLLTWPEPTSTCGSTGNSTINDTCYAFERYNLDAFTISIFDDSFATIIGTSMNLSIQLLTQTLCRATVEATVTSTVYASQNFADGIRVMLDAAVLSALGIDHHHLQKLPFFLICVTLLDILSLLYVPFLPKQSVNDLKPQEIEITEVSSPPVVPVQNFEGEEFVI